MKKLIVFVLAMVMIACGTITAFAATSDSTTTTTTKATTDTHTCNISRANENYHRFECEVCENYSRVEHDEFTMECLEKNEFFHTWSCADCGYEYAEKHDFETAYTTTTHQEVCVDCGYTLPAEAHVMVNAFYGNNHDIECEYCGYVVEHHVRVKYATVDEYGCTATCSCGVVEVVEHDWDGFVCDNCNYVVTGPTCGLVERITEYDDYYRIRINVEDVIYKINVNELTVEEGDFVVIEHNGNEIYGVSTLVEFEAVDDAANLPIYVESDILNQMGYVGYNSNTVADIISAEEDVIIAIFEDGRAFHFTNFVVYDFVNTEFADYDFVEEGNRLVWFSYNGQTVILNYYW